MKKQASSRILVLVADDDEEERQFITDVLESHGFFVIQAINGGAAIKVIEEWGVDVAVIAEHMKPNDGFEVAKHTLLKQSKTGIIMITDNPTTDLLLRAGELGVGQVMRKPIEPGRLAQTVKRMVRAQGKNPDALSGDDTVTYKPEEIMDRVLALANQNARSHLGGPFAAIVVDKEGHLLGEGVNGVKARCDPTAHAEVLAIRRATEKINSPRLDECSIYCSSEPTMLGEALIIGTGITEVYYGISHEEAGTPRVAEQGIMGEIAKPLSERTVPHKQLKSDEAMALFKEWKQN